MDRSAPSIHPEIKKKVYQSDGYDHESSSSFISSPASQLWPADSPWRSPLAPPTWNRSCIRASPGTCGSRRTSRRTGIGIRSVRPSSCTSSTCSPSPPPELPGSRPSQVRRRSPARRGALRAPEETSTRRSMGRGIRRWNRLNFWGRDLGSTWSRNSAWPDCRRIRSYWRTSGGLPVPEIRALPPWFLSFFFLPTHEFSIRPWAKATQIARLKLMENSRIG